MKYRLAIGAEVETVHKLVENTIKTIYPRYYPTEVVDFFATITTKMPLLKMLQMEM